MATIRNFEDLLVWQEAREITKFIYEITRSIPDIDFRRQIQRASVSIMNNIAEGFDRNKIDDTNRSFIYFLDISFGSTGEVRSMSYLANDLQYISDEDSILLRNKCISISNKLYAFIQNLKNNPKPHFGIK